MTGPRYFIERVCGGCGAPRGVSEVSKERFVSMEGRIYFDYVDHLPNEAPLLPEGALVKVDFGSCRACREI